MWLKCKKGFTLIEVLVAVTLLAVISFLVFQAMGTSVKSKERFEKKDESFRSASLAIERLSRDLQMAVLYSSIDLLGVSPSGEKSTASVFIGKNSGDQDQLTFNTVSHVRYLKDARESDLAEVGYFLETSAEGGEFFVLKKREASPPDAEPAEGGIVLELLGGVKELNFRYYDPKKGEFVEDWDSTTVDFLNRLPRAVEITMVIEDPVDEGETLRFATVAFLEMSPGPNDF